MLPVDDRLSVTLYYSEGAEMVDGRFNLVKMKRFISDLMRRLCGPTLQYLLLLFNFESVQTKTPTRPDRKRTAQLTVADL